jgi:SAM-dependent methyltransferase
MADMDETTSAYRPHGAALLDYWAGETGAMLACEQDGERDDVPAAFWFRALDDAMELDALARVRGRVLDVGAGTGIHTLELQRRGVEVTAIDVAPECVEIMRLRGVHDARVADLYSFNGGPFDTVVCLCNGLDKVGRLADLPRFLERMRALVAPGGQLLADSFDLRGTRVRPDGRYCGEMDLVFEYRGRRGAPFTVLQVDPDTLREHAERGGWAMEIVVQDGKRYLACLTPR